MTRIGSLRGSTKQGLQIRTVNSMVTALRSTILTDEVQKQFAFFPRNFHDPEHYPYPAEGREASLGADTHAKSRSLARRIAEELGAIQQALAMGQVEEASRMLNVTHTRAVAVAADGSTWVHGGSQ